MTPDQLSSLIECVEKRVVTTESDFDRLLTDSRKLTDGPSTLFFAIPTKRNNGAYYVRELYDKGVRNFVVGDTLDDAMRQDLLALPSANFWFVSDVVGTLQYLVENHRRKFDIPVIGITGSNGKTIVKDWIVQLLSADHNIVANPKSYNSQIGVPLSVWQMNDGNDMAVFEAGISEAGKMDALRKVIQPTIGIFTNIGQAHDENFLTRYQKIAEKLQLFIHCETLIYCTDHKDIHSVVSENEILRNLHRFTWGQSDENQVQLLDTKILSQSTVLSVCFHSDSGDSPQFDLEIPFVDRASIENAMHCVTLMLFLGYPPETVCSRCHTLTPVEMRLEMDEGINNCLLINDSYSLDLNSLSIALDFMQHEHQHYHKTLIMSDIMQAGLPEQELYSQVSSLLSQKGVTRFVGIGEALMRSQLLFNDLETWFYPSTEEFLMRHPVSEFQNETILLKGARVFGFENIAKVLKRKQHETIMEVDLDALVRNVNFYRSRINPSTKLMAMVKASSYGTGRVEIANTLQFNHVDYLTVAYCDEGVELRRNGITLPIMVMNPEEESFDNIIRYQLEPDIYSFRILELFSEAVRLYTGRIASVPVHIELDTGMHRLGFDPSDMPKLAELLGKGDYPVKIRSIFSHLACSEDPAMDDFTRTQIEKFRSGASTLKSLLGDNSILCHILNSSGITRFPDAQMDMVRLGIGLYGVSPEPDIQRMLSTVSRLKTRISQIKTIPAGEPVGYNCRWVAQRDSRIAIIPIGYADGLSRHLGNGKGFVEIAGTEVPIIGSICMDMCFVDVTDVECHEGDDVLIFGSSDQLVRLADAAGTIPYEILTSISPRVKRVYISE